MATIGYNEGYYSRSKWNDLAFQGEAEINAVSNMVAVGSVVVGGQSTIPAVSSFSSEGTKIFLGTANIQGTSNFSSEGTQIFRELHFSGLDFFNCAYAQK